MPSPASPGEHADVALRLPADSAYVSVLRTTTAGLAARLDFTIDDIEDLRIAVGEACAVALPAADPGSDLEASFHLAPGRLTVAVTVSGAEVGEPDRAAFAWQVLDTLASSATASVDGDRLTITLTMEAETWEPAL